MVLPLNHWCELYAKLKHAALCLDIETTGWNKPISIIGLYRPQDGIPEVIQLIRGENLTRDNLRWALQGCKLFITYNGIKFDLPRIRAEFSGVIPYNIPVLDLYRFAKRCGMKTVLITLENTFRIERMEPFSKRKGIAVKLWKRYQLGDRESLRRLLEYNRQDTINLYPLAEELTQRALSALRRNRGTGFRAPAFPRIGGEE
jgi:uncharacterized protein